MLRNEKRVLIGDPHVLLAEACKKFLEPEFEVVGIAKDGWQVIRAMTELEPRIMVIDIDMPPMGGIALVRALKKARHPAKFVFLSSDASSRLAAQALQIGASGYVLKQASIVELITTLRKVSRGQSYLSSPNCADVLEFLRDHENGNANKRLSDRELQVLELLARGLSMKEAGHLLNIESRTIAFHKYRMMEKLSVKNNAELMEYAIRRGMTGSVSRTVWHEQPVI